MLQRHVSAGLVFQALLLLAISTEVVGATSVARPTAPWAGALFVAFAIAYLSRRRAIGGWLLYFYVQLYASFAFTLFFLPSTLSDLNPTNWDNTELYVAGFLSTVPYLIATSVEVVAATQLLIKRNSRSFELLRGTLLAVVATAMIGMLIDAVYFSDSQTLALDIFAFFMSAVWASYFYQSKRVRRVFVDGNWDYPSFAPRRITTTNEKRHVMKRSVIAGTLTFLGVLLGMATLEPRPSVGHIFVVAMFSGVLVAAIAWYYPLRRRTPTLEIFEKEQQEPKILDK